VDSQQLGALLDKHGVPGASLAVLHDGEVDTAAAGVLHLGTGVEATTDSLFQIGSITKVWTATMVLQLADEGALELDDPVRRHLPDFRVADEDVSARVTIRHLLTHSSGIDGDHFTDTGRGDDVLERYVASCTGLSQVHALGATMSYCNTGYSVLGRVVEVVTGTVWDQALRTRLIEPLGLTHVATLPEDVLRFRAAMGHIAPPGADLAPAPVWSLPRSLGPAGLICATASDLVAFARMHLDDGPLAAMREAQVAVPSGGNGLFPERWGLGWAVYTWGDRTVIGHDGGTIGQSAFLRVVPGAGAAVALLTNGGNAIALFEDVARDLLAEVGGVEMPAFPSPPAASAPFDASSYLGRYAREGMQIDVVARDGGMVGVSQVTGPGAAMTPEPFELPFHPLDAEGGRFLTRHPAAPDTWLTVQFLTLSDGSDCVHIGGRATPKVDD
jgi:CubicO group peptidase (beta-lactamase class C family)